MPGSPPVVVHQGELPGQLLEDLMQERVLPFHPEVAERHPRDEDERGAIADDREGQAHTIRAASIADARNPHHEPTISSWPCMERAELSFASVTALAVPPTAVLYPDRPPPALVVLRRVDRDSLPS